MANGMRVHESIKHGPIDAEVVGFITFDHLAAFDGEKGRASLGFLWRKTLLTDLDRPDGERVPFRLLDDDREIYYEGWLVDDECARVQSKVLAWGEADAGCTILEVLRGGRWIAELG